MSKSRGPRAIRRIAARRMFKSPDGKPVVLTIGVPEPDPVSNWADWRCAVQITGLNTALRRPRYLFGVDGLQALHLAMMFADAELELSGVELEWLGQKGDLGMPKFLPNLPKPQRDRLAAMVERETDKCWRAMSMDAKKAKSAQRSTARSVTSQRTQNR